MRIGIAGLGGMGLIHAVNAQTVTGGELVAVASAARERATTVAEQLGGAVRACTYPELFAAEDIDAIVISGRTIDHAAHAIEVLRHDKHLFLEKPGATTMAAHDELRAEAAKHPAVVVQAGYMRRYDPAFQQARRFIESGDIGTPLVVLCTSRDAEFSPSENPSQSGGCILDTGVHDFDTACWFLGQEPAEVHAVGQAQVYPELATYGDVDNAVVTLSFQGEGLAVTHVSRTCAFGHDIRCEVLGTEGSVFVGNSAGSPGVTVLRREDHSAFPRDFRERYSDAYREELAAFVAACNGNGPLGPGLEDDRRAVAAGVAARASALCGRPLAVGVDWPWSALA